MTHFFVLLYALILTTSSVAQSSSDHIKYLSNLCLEREIYKAKSNIFFNSFPNNQSDLFFGNWKKVVHFQKNPDTHRAFSDSQSRETFNSTLQLNCKRQSTGCVFYSPIRLDGYFKQSRFEMSDEGKLHTYDKKSDRLEYLRQCRLFTDTFDHELSLACFDYTYYDCRHNDEGPLLIEVCSVYKREHANDVSPSPQDTTVRRAAKHHLSR